MYLQEVSDRDLVLVEHPVPLLLVVLAPGQLLEEVFHRPESIG